MRAHLVQLDIAWEDKHANMERVRRLLGGAAVKGGDLVILPEMFDTGFSFNLERTADADGSTLAFIQELARELGVTVQGGRTVVGPDGRGRNRAPVAGPDGEVLVEYEKIHPFSFGRETEYFAGGSEVLTYAWGGLTVCPAVCYDLRFPELFRVGMLRGAEVFSIGANWPAPRAHHWRALLIARAIENQAYVLGVNRRGEDPQLAYAGGTIAVGPRGDVIGELGDEEGVLTVEVQPDEVRTWREVFPAWRDVRLLA